MKRSTLTALALLATSAFSVLPAQADTFVDLGFNIVNGVNVPQQWNSTNMGVLTVTDQVPNGNQVDNIPCIICGKNQPAQPANFGYNLFGNTGNESNVSFFSTSVSPSGGQSSGLAIDQIGAGYNVGDGSAFKLALLGRTDFTIGLDVNDANGQPPQTLESCLFLNLTTHTVLAAFSPGPGGMLIPGTNNGTGYPDYTISGFDIDRTDIHLGDQLIFFARISGATDGPDSFFLNPNVAAVPGPIVGAGPVGLAAASLFGLNFWRRRRNGNTLPA